MIQGMQFTCPACGERHERLIRNFHPERDKQVIDALKGLFPKWSIERGICTRCLDGEYLRLSQELDHGSGGPNFFTILPTPLRLEASNEYSGQGVTICFIDSGFYFHPDLEGRILKVVDITHPRRNANYFKQPHDESWHGTMTSVVAAGDGRKSSGLYRGIASKANLVLLKVQDDSGITGENIAKALNWATRNRKKYNIKIINLSVTDDWPISFKNSRVDMAAENAIKNGIVVIAAVGNSPSASVKPPANSPHVIAVGGVDDHNTLGRSSETIYHSTYGTTTDGFIKPEIIAPSIWLAAPILPGTESHDKAKALFRIYEAPEQKFKTILKKEHLRASLPPEVVKEPMKVVRKLVKQLLGVHKFLSPHYQHADGTSFAAPIVCSVVAQMLEANPNLSPSIIRNLLLSSARKLPHIPVERQGYGVIDAPSAVQAAEQENPSHSQLELTSPVVDKEEGKIKFFYHNDVVRRVGLVGTFNHWESNKDVFKCDDRQLWTIEIPMLSPGKYLYKFVLNNQNWVDDPTNLHKESDGYNGFNSILEIR